MAIPFTLAIEGDLVQAFTASPIGITLKVTGVVPDEEPVNDNADEELWGNVLPTNEELLWRWVLIVTAVRFKVEADAALQDHGDYRLLKRVLAQNYTRIIAVGTNLPRINTTDDEDHNFWVDEDGRGLIDETDGLLVKCTSWPMLSPNNAQGSDTVTFTLKTVYPHRKNS